MELCTVLWMMEWDFAGCVFQDGIKVTTTNGTHREFTTCQARGLVFSTPAKNPSSHHITSTLLLRKRRLKGSAARLRNEPALVCSQSLRCLCQYEAPQPPPLLLGPWKKEHPALRCWQAARPGYTYCASAGRRHSRG